MIRVGVVSLGCPYHGNIFVNNMNANLKHYAFKFLTPSEEYGWASVNPRELDVLWFYGFHALPDLLISKFKGENPKLKVVVTWVGSDLLEFVAFATHRPQCRACIIKDVDMHVADGLTLQKELERLDIKSEYIPSIPEKPWELKPLPEKFAVAAYVPGFRAEFYNYSMIRDVAEQMQDVEFNLFGGGGVAIPTDLSNMSYLGWVEGERKQALWEGSSVLLYMPKHGSLGVTAIEFLQMGRWVVCSQEYPHVFKCSSAYEILDVLSQLRIKKEGNLEGSRFYHSEFSVQKQAEKVKQVLNRF